MTDHIDQDRPGRGDGAAGDAHRAKPTSSAFEIILPALGERPAFEVGEAVSVRDHSPIGHYRVPIYLRGHVGTVVRIIEPVLVDNEAEGYGRNAGSRLHYYRVAFPLTELWSRYEGAPGDELHVEIFETWLERAQ